MHALKRTGSDLDWLPFEGGIYELISDGAEKAG